MMALQHIVRHARKRKEGAERQKNPSGPPSSFFNFSLSPGAKVLLAFYWKKKLRLNYNASEPFGTHPELDRVYERGVLLPALVALDVGVLLLLLLDREEGLLLRRIPARSRRGCGNRRWRRCSRHREEE